MICSHGHLHVHYPDSWNSKTPKPMNMLLLYSLLNSFKHTARSEGTRWVRSTYLGQYRSRVEGPHYLIAGYTRLLFSLCLLHEASLLLLWLDGPKFMWAKDVPLLYQRQAQVHPAKSCNLPNSLWTTVDFVYFFLAWAHVDPLQMPILWWHSCVCACSVTRPCLTLCDPMACNSPGSSVHGIFQARILEWVAISFSRGSSRPRDQTWVSYVSHPGRRILYHYISWEVIKPYGSIFLFLPFLKVPLLSVPLYSNF